MPAPRPRRISDIMPKIQNVALTTDYLVRFTLPPSGLRNHLRRKGIDSRFIGDDVGLLCSGAVLPGSALASQNITGDFQGIVERFAHTRNFTQINFEFYVDNQYKTMKFLEHWMEYITGANQVDPGNDVHYFQLNYPHDYKSNDTTVVKFERNHNQFLEYRFIGLFPLALNSVRVQYGNSQILKATCSFSYDRYISGESSSLLRDLRRAYNDLGFGRGNVSRDGLSLKDDQLNEIAFKQVLSVLNPRSDVLRQGSYTALSNQSSPYQLNVKANAPNAAPGISP